MCSIYKEWIFKRAFKYNIFNSSVFREVCVCLDNIVILTTWISNRNRADFFACTKAFRSVETKEKKIDFFAFL